MSDEERDQFWRKRVLDRREILQIPVAERFWLMFGKDLDFQECAICGHRDAPDVLKCDECGFDFPR